MKRFVTEYANDKKHRIYKLMEEYPRNKEVYDYAISFIDSCIDAYKRGYLSTDETMEYIAGSLTKACEWSR